MFDPPASVVQEERRRQARVISAALFVFSLSTISGGLFTPDSLGMVRLSLQIATVPQVLLYLLSRTSYYRLAAMMAIPLLSATTYISMIFMPVYNQATIAANIMWLMLPMGMAVITLSLPYILIFLAINVALFSSMPALLGFDPQHLGNGLSFVIISSLMLVIIAVIRNRDVSELHNMTRELHQQKEFLELEIKERREAEVELSNLQTLINSVNESILLVSSNGVIEKVNDTALNMFGYTRQQLVGHKLSDLVAPDLEGEADALFMGILREQKDKQYRWHEFLARRLNKSTFSAEAYASTIRSNGGHSLVVTVRDMTEHKRIERLKDEFISSVSHELRTPLTSIHGAIGIVKGVCREELSEKVKGLIDIAHQNSSALSALVDDILDLSSLEAGKVHMQYENVDIHSLLMDIIRINSPMADKYGVSFELINENRIMIQTDVKRLTQVINNLLSNAVKHSPRGESVTIDYESESDGGLHIRVADLGAGIPEEFQSRIFDKFFQVHETSKQARSGTGLGLSISKHIVEQMGGKIWLQSDPRNTCFHIELPAQPAS
ncbi:MAG: PAS domain-containing sensor histidine kinase [Gammaproteobacteria bacterium]|nr:PAS domain-containing sensor histidine kinase [Gammaproteobacteria bacterium]